MNEKKKPRATFELYVLWNSGESCTGTGTKKACLEQHELFAGSPFIKEAYVERMEDGLSTHVLALWRARRTSVGGVNTWTKIECRRGEFGNVYENGMGWTIEQKLDATDVGVSQSSYTYRVSHFVVFAPDGEEYEMPTLVEARRFVREHEAGGDA